MMRKIFLLLFVLVSNFSFGQLLGWPCGACSVCDIDLLCDTTCICLNPPLLPVAITSLSNKQVDDKVEISWTSASEKNNDFYTVEKSKDGINFTEMAHVKGAGNSSTEINYTCYDENPSCGINYYRLKQTDHDGKSIYCKSATADFIPEDFVLSCQHTETGLMLKVTSEKQQDIFVSLINSSGRMIHSENLFIHKGINEMKIELAELPASLYILHALIDGKSISKKIVYSHDVSD